MWQCKCFFILCSAFWGNFVSQVFYSCDALYVDIVRHYIQVAHLTIVNYVISSRLVFAYYVISRY